MDPAREQYLLSHFSTSALRLLQMMINVLKLALSPS
jgi:hypothetical protein